MEDTFDKYLKQELDSLSNAPISSQLWDKEKTWGKINSGLKPQGKTISIIWLYAAASIVFIVLVGSSFYHINYTTQISQMKIENQRLLKMIETKNIALNQKEIKPEKIVTVIQTKEKIRKEIVLDTLYVHDTITIVSYAKNQVNEQVALINTPVVSDSSFALSSDKPAKKNKLYFVVTSEFNGLKDENKYKFVSSKDLIQKEQETVRHDFTFNIALN